MATRHAATALRGSAQSSGNLTVAIEDRGDEGTCLVCTGGPGGLRLSAMTPILDRLGVEIESFGVEKGTQQTSTVYVVSDSGRSLPAPTVLQLVEALEQDLHAQVVSTPNKLQLELSKELCRAWDGGVHGPSGPGRPASSAAVPVSPFSLQPPTPQSDADDDSLRSHRSKHGKSVSWARSPSPQGSAASIAVPSTAADDSTTASPPAGQVDQAVVEHEDSGHSHPSAGSNEDQDGRSTWWGCISPQDPVSMIMSMPVRWISQDETLGEAKALMTRWNISSLMVDTKTPQPGFLTMRGFLNASFTKSLKKAKVKEVMSQPVIFVTANTGIEHCLQVMQTSEQQVRRVAIFDPAKFDSKNPSTWRACWVGVVSDTDIFRCLGQPKSVGGFGCEPPSNTTGMHSVVGPSVVSSASGSLQSTASGITSPHPPLIRSITTEDRYRAAAALWELDFSELELIRKVGEGSFGEVMLANLRGTKVAVKRLRGFETSEEGAPSPTIQPVLNQFFEREIGILASIRHPNIVGFLGACHTPPNIALVTEYCARGSLDQLLHKSGLNLDLAKRVEMAMDVARGMSALHAAKPPIIHRDMKTANLLVSARLEVKVADFGLSRIKDHAQLVNSRAGLEGTVEYCAPEVLRGEPFTEKCDIYSFGVVCWELFNRQRPFADADVPIFLLMLSLGNGQLKLPPLSENVSSPGLVRLWERCMAWEPQERPSFREVLHALENEYKVVRGKAAAVPRSDSAYCMSGRDMPSPPILPATASQQNMVEKTATADAAGPSAPAALPEHRSQPSHVKKAHSRFAPAGAGAAQLQGAQDAGDSNWVSAARRSSRRMQRSTSTPVEPLWLDSGDSDDLKPLRPRLQPLQRLMAGGAIHANGVAGAHNVIVEAGSSELGSRAGSYDSHVDQSPAAASSVAEPAAAAPSTMQTGPSKSPFALASPFGSYPAFDLPDGDGDKDGARELGGPQATAALDSGASGQQDTPSSAQSGRVVGSCGELMGLDGATIVQDDGLAASQPTPSPPVKIWVSPFANTSAFSESGAALDKQDEEVLSGEEEEAPSYLSAADPNSYHCPALITVQQLPGGMVSVPPMGAIVAPSVVAEGPDLHEHSPCSSPGNPPAPDTMHTTSWMVF